MKNLSLFICLVFFSLCFSCPVFAEDLFDQAMDLYENSQYAEAVVQLQLLIADGLPEATASQVLFYLGQSYQKLENDPQAIQCYREVLDQYPDTSIAEEALFGLGYLLKAQGQAAESVIHLENLLNRTESPLLKENGLFHLAHAYHLSGNYPSAIEKYNQFLEAYPNAEGKVIALFGLAQSLRSGAYYPESIEVYGRLRRQYPNSEWAEHSLYNMAQAYYAAGDRTSAITRYQEFLAQYPQSPTAGLAKFDIGCIQNTSGDYASAIETLQAMLTQYPDCSRVVDALFHLGQAYHSSGDISLAVQTYQKILDQFPQSEYASSALYFQGWALKDMGQEDEAIQKYQTLVANFPGSPTDQLMYSHFAIGVALLKKADQLRQTNPDDPLAAHYEDQGRSQLYGLFQDEELTLNLKLEGIYYLKDLETLEADAQDYLATHTAQQEGWGTAMTWLGVVQAMKSPPDLAAAATTLDTVLQTDFKASEGDKGYLLTRAKLWRGWIALNQGDEVLARRLYGEIRESTPERAVKKESLDILGAYLQIPPE